MRPNASRPAQTNVQQRIRTAEANAQRQAVRPPVAPGPGRVRQLINATEEATQRLWRRVRPVRPNASRPAQTNVQQGIRTAEANAQRQADALRRHKNELRDIIRQREERTRQAVRDAAVRRDARQAVRDAAARRNARPAVRPPVAPRPGRVRRLINAIEEAAQRLWRRVMPTVRPSVVPRVRVAPQVAARFRPVPRPRVLPHLAAVNSPAPQPAPQPAPHLAVPRPEVVQPTDDDPVIFPRISRPRIFPTLDPVEHERALAPDEDPTEPEDTELRKEVEPTEHEEDFEDTDGTPEEDDNDKPGVAPNKKEVAEEPKKVTPTEMPVSSSRAPAPPARTKSLGTRNMPSSKTIESNYTGFTSLVKDIESWLRKTPAPKVVSSLTSKNDTKITSEMRGFVPKDRHINHKEQRRMLTQDSTQQADRSITTDTIIQEINDEDDTDNWFSNLWENIKSVGRKITKFVRPLMFWVH